MDYLQEVDCKKAKLLIDTLDLTPIIQRLINIENWSQGQAEEACQQYRNYLYLKKKYGHQYELPPSVDIDEVWHAHILHTEDYKDFCLKVFGDYLHHHPHHGKETKLTTQELEQMYEEQTQRLYWEEFGETLYAVRPTPFLESKFFKILKNVISIFKVQKLANSMER